MRNGQKRQTKTKVPKVPKVKKKKRPKLAVLHDKAWAVFSKWVRARDGRCITCGSYDTLQAGHFWHNCLDFDEMNINAQCSACNHYRSGNLALYAAYLLHKYGPEEFNKLEIRHYLSLKGDKKSEQDYLGLIAKYRI